MSNPGTIRVFEVTFESGSKVRILLIRDNENFVHYLYEGYNSQGQLTGDYTRTYPSNEIAERKLADALARYKSEGGRLSRTEVTLEQQYFPDEIIVADPPKKEVETPGQRTGRKKTQKQAEDKQADRPMEKPIVTEDRTQARTPQTATARPGPTTPKTNASRPTDRTRLPRPRQQGRDRGPGGVEGALQNVERGRA